MRPASRRVRGGEGMCTPTSLSRASRDGILAANGADGQPAVRKPRQRRLPESNRCKRLCRRLRNPSAKAALGEGVAVGSGADRLGGGPESRFRFVPDVQVKQKGEVAYREATDG